MSKVDLVLYNRLCRQLYWIKLNHEKVYLDSIVFATNGGKIKVNLIKKKKGVSIE